MAGAYSTIANDGVYIEPTFYSEIQRNNGKTLVKTKQKSRRVFSKEVAYILKEILTEPVQGENGTATYCKISGVDVAAKTGTTDENYDRWLCGFTPYYTAVTWYGFDQNESINFNQRNPAGLIWANVMARIHTGLNSAEFEKPTMIQTATICSKTGKRATTGCPDTYTEYFLWFTKPGLCDEHSGSEVKDNDSSKTNNKTNVTEIIQGITNEIDEKEPPRTTEPTSNTNTNTNTTNNNVNTTNNTNTTNNNTSNSNTNTTNSTTNNTNTNNSNSSSGGNTSSSGENETTNSGGESSNQTPQNTTNTSNSTEVVGEE